jgi:predicted metal-dependent hydrolase
MQVRQVQDIEYELLPGADRKTTDIVIERDGVIRVRPPRKMTPEQVDETVFSKRLWIYRNLAEWRDLNASGVVREWVNGESFLFLGNSYRLALVDVQEEPLKLKDGRFLLSRSVLHSGGTENAKKIFQDFYTEKGYPKIKRRVEYFSALVGVVIRDIEVKELGFRWASCAADAKLQFHWKCLMAPLRVLDYIVVHELCHLHWRDHSHLFWNEVDKVLPMYREHKEWLRRRGANFDL